MISLFFNLLLSCIMVTATVVIHFLGLVLLLRLISWHGKTVANLHEVLRQCVLLIMAVLGIVFLHTVEIWSYAFVFQLLGAVTGFERALYFSTVTFSSLGYGDITLNPQWRVFGAIEAANGVILFGWSTAFLISLMSKLRTLEHDWLEK